MVCTGVEEELTVIDKTSVGQGLCVSFELDTHWSSTITSSCWVYCCASRKARSLASELYIKNTQDNHFITESGNRKQNIRFEYVLAGLFTQNWQNRRQTGSLAGWQLSARHTEQCCHARTVNLCSKCPFVQQLLLLCWDGNGPLQKGNTEHDIHMCTISTGFCLLNCFISICKEHQCIPADSTKG